MDLRLEAHPSVGPTLCNSASVHTIRITDIKYELWPLVRHLLENKTSDRLRN